MSQTHRGIFGGLTSGGYRSAPLARSSSAVYLSRVRERALLLFTATLFVAGFYLSYAKLIQPYYGYEGFGLFPRTLADSVMSWGIALAPATVLPTRWTRPSGLVVWIMYVLAYVPSVLVPVWSLDKPYAELVTLQFFLLTSFSVLALVSYWPPLPVRRVRVRSHVFWAVFTFTAIGVYASLYSSFGFRLPPGIFDVYAVRLEARQVVAQTGRFLGYALRLASNMVAPFLIAVGLMNRRAWVVGLGVLASLAVYSFDGTKSTLLAPLAIVGMWLFTRESPPRASRFMLIGAGIVWGFSMVDMVLGRPLLTGVFLRRVMAVPGLLTGYYYDFFSKNPPFVWSYSVLAPFVPNPYPYAAPAFLVGDVYFGNAATSANANLWADGFANLGFVGMVLETLILAGYLWLYDGIARRRDRTFAQLMMVLASFTLSNASVLTSLWTHGLFAILVLLFMAPVTTASPDKAKW